MGRSSSPFFDNNNFSGHSFSSTTSTFSSFGGNGATSKSIQTVTEIKDGQRVTKTVTTVRHPDGRVERSEKSEETPLNIGDGEKKLMKLEQSSRDKDARENDTREKKKKKRLSFF